MTQGRARGGIASFAGRLVPRQPGVRRVRAARPCAADASVRARESESPRYSLHETSCDFVYRSITIYAHIYDEYDRVRADAGVPEPRRGVPPGSTHRASAPARRAAALPLVRAPLSLSRSAEIDVACR